MYPTEQQALSKQAENLLRPFAPISLDEMAEVALLNRTDTKYLIRLSQLPTILEQIKATYQVLEVNHKRLNHYLTLYFDTPNFALYNAHHNGLSSRYKVRARKYLDSDLSFFEVKHKTNQRRTIKSRMQIARLRASIDPQASAFVDRHTPYTARALEPKLWNDYFRMTFVSKQQQERLTLDLNLMFYWGAAEALLPGIVIAEVKQGHFSRQSDFIQQMRHLGIRPASFSKYTVGVYRLYEHVKMNRFKNQMQQINKMMQAEATL